MPHSTLRAGREGWSERDRLLAVALQVYEDSLHSCGHPWDWTTNEDAEGYFEVVEHVCQACAAREVHAKERDGKERAPGAVASVVNVMKPGERWKRG